MKNYQLIRKKTISFCRYCECCYLNPPLHISDMTSNTEKLIEPTKIVDFLSKECQHNKSCDSCIRTPCTVLGDKCKLKSVEIIITYLLYLLKYCNVCGEVTVMALMLESMWNINENFLYFYLYMLYK